MKRWQIILLAVLFMLLVMAAEAVFANEIYLPSVSRNKIEMTVEPGATPTAWVSPGGPIFRVTLTPTVAPTQEPQP